MGKAGDTVSGAAGGAAIGTAILPGWGTAIGAGVGGLAGYFGSGGSDGGLTEEQQAMYDQYIRGVMGREAPLMENSSLQGNQRNLIGALEAQASGRGPSLAAEQLKAATDRNQRQQQSFANSARGSAAPLAAFQAQNNGSALAAQAAQDAAAARIVEINSARAQLGQNLQAGRSADEATARANLESQLRAMGMNDEAIARYMGTGSGKAPAPSTGELVGAAGLGAANTIGQMRAGQAANKPSHQPESTYTPYGDNTMNPYKP